MRTVRNVMWLIPLLWLVMDAAPVYSATVQLKNGTSIECDQVWKGTGNYIWIRKSRGIIGYPIAEVNLKATFGERSPQITGKNQGAEEKGIKQALVRELWELSGLNKQVAQLGELSVAGLKDQYEQGSLPPRLYENLVPIAREAYKVEKIRHSLLARIEYSLDSATIEAVLSWLRSPLGRRITKLEEDASTPEGVRRQKNYAALLQQDPPSQERLKLVKRLDEAIGATESMIDMVTITVRETMSGLIATVPGSLDIDPYTLEQMMNNRRRQMRPLFQEAAMVSFLYTYQSLAEDELGRYVAFAESDDARRYHQSILQELKVIQSEAASYLAKHLIKAYRETEI